MRVSPNYLIHDVKEPGVATVRLEGSARRGTEGIGGAGSTKGRGDVHTNGSSRVRSDLVGVSSSSHRESEDIRRHKEALATVRLLSQRFARALEAGRLLSDGMLLCAEIAAELRCFHGSSSASAVAAAVAANVGVSRPVPVSVSRVAPHSESGPLSGSYMAAGPAKPSAASTPSASTMMSSFSGAPPKLYYELFLAVTGELRAFEVHVLDVVKAGHIRILQLYEEVQKIQSIVPRLYMLITIGAVYIKSLQAPARDVLKDLSEMCCGVQHPQRGLFLRSYLSQCMRDKLPDKGNPFEGKGGDVKDSVDFLLKNLTEMNRLWVRMQHNCPLKEKERRMKERKELQILVGSNLSAISRLGGVHVEMYKSAILPHVASQIVNCHDPIAQEYLAETLVNVFPDEYHLQCLDAFLEMCSKLESEVNMRSIVDSLCSRLGAFCTKSTDNTVLVKQSEAISVFRKRLPAIIEAELRGSMPMEHVAATYLSFLRFSLKAEPQNFETPDFIYGHCYRTLTQEQIQETTNQHNIVYLNDSHPTMIVRGSQLEIVVVDLLCAPLAMMPSIREALLWNNWLPLSKMLPYGTWRRVANQLLGSMRDFDPCLSQTSEIDKLFDYVEPLVVPDSRTLVNMDRDVIHHPYFFAEDASVEPVLVQKDSDDGIESQGLVARIIFLVNQSNLCAAFEMLKALRLRLSAGGAERCRITMPPLVHQLLQLAIRSSASILEGLGDATRAPAPFEILTYASETIGPLAEADAEGSLRLYLKGALATLPCVLKDAETVVYDFLSHAFVLFEEELSGSRAQFAALNLITGSLLSTRSKLTKSDYDSLRNRVLRHARRLLTKADQCLALCSASTLFGVPGGNHVDSDDEPNAEKLNFCLDLAIQAACSSMSVAERALLLVDVLIRVTYYLEKGGTAGERERVMWLVAQIQDLLNKEISPEGRVGKVVAARFSRAVLHIQSSLNVSLDDVNATRPQVGAGT